MLHISESHLENDAMATIIITMSHQLALEEEIILQVALEMSVLIMICLHGARKLVLLLGEPLRLLWLYSYPTTNLAEYTSRWSQT